MALYTAWYDDISSVVSLLHSAVDDGLRRLRYERIKTEQLDASESLLSGKHVNLSMYTHWIWEVSGVPSAAVLCKKPPAQPCITAPLTFSRSDIGSTLSYVFIGKKSCLADTIKGRVTHVLGSPESFIGNKS